MNLVNFMDGIDWISVVEVVPVSAGIALFGICRARYRTTLPFVAMALGGAMLGFAPFNRPVAELFLGDVGSLPIGLLLGWLLIAAGRRGVFRSRTASCHSIISRIPPSLCCGAF